MRQKTNPILGQFNEFLEKERDLFNSDLRAKILIALSTENNTPENAIKNVSDALSIILEHYPNSIEAQKLSAELNKYLSMFNLGFNLDQS